MAERDTRVDDTRRCEPDTAAESCGGMSWPTICALLIAVEDHLDWARQDDEAEPAGVSLSG